MPSLFHYNGPVVTMGKVAWTVPFPVYDARFLDGRVLLIYEYSAGPTDTAFHNFEAFDMAGRKLWTAEHPGIGPADAYVSFVSDRPLVVWNYACMNCTIEPSTGRLLTATFVK